LDFIKRSPTGVWLTRVGAGKEWEI
jgi:hypothetical protein